MGLPQQHSSAADSLERWCLMSAVCWSRPAPSLTLIAHFYPVFPGSLFPEVKRFPVVEDVCGRAEETVPQSQSGEEPPAVARSGQLFDVNGIRLQVLRKHETLANFRFLHLTVADCGAFRTLFRCILSHLCNGTFLFILIEG